MPNPAAPVAPAPMVLDRAGLVERTYFIALSSFLLLLSLIGFSDNLITNVGQPSNRDPKFVIHGLFWLAWFTLFVVQSLLIQKGRRATHRRLGVLTMWVGVGVILSTVYIFVVNYAGWREMFIFAKVNRFLMLGFVIFLGLALKHRGRPRLHKRFILMANLFVLLPIIDRVSARLDLNPDLFMLLCWNGLFASAFLYDRAVLGRTHPITAVGYGGFWLAWATAALL